MNAVIIARKMASTNVGSLIKEGKNTTTDIPNGTPVVIGKLLTGAMESNVFSVTPATAIAKGLGLALSPEVGSVVSGDNSFKNLDKDPRNFTNVKGKTFTVKIPVQFDEITVSKEFFADKKDPTTVQNATVVELNAQGKFEAKVSATASYDGLGFAIKGTTKIAIGSNVNGGSSIVGYVLECTNN